MATRDFGVSFQPGVNGNGQARNGSGPQPPRNSIQEAIQMLSLRMPKVFGARAIAPAPLLTSPGGMGQPAARGNVSAQALASLAGLPSGRGMPSMPAPMIPTPPLAGPTPRQFAPLPGPTPGQPGTGPAPDGMSFGDDQRSYPEPPVLNPPPPRGAPRMPEVLPNIEFGRAPAPPPVLPGPRLTYGERVGRYVGPGDDPGPTPPGPTEFFDLSQPTRPAPESPPPVLGGGAAFGPRTDTGEGPGPSPDAGGTIFGTREPTPPPQFDMQEIQRLVDELFRNNQIPNAFGGFY